MNKSSRGAILIIAFGIAGCRENDSAPVPSDLPCNAVANEEELIVADAKKAARGMTSIRPGMKLDQVEALMGMPDTGEYRYIPSGDSENPNRYLESYWVYLVFPSHSEFETGLHGIALEFEKRADGDIFIRNLGIQSLNTK